VSSDIVSPNDRHVDNGFAVDRISHQVRTFPAAMAMVHIDQFQYAHPVDADTSTVSGVFPIGSEESDVEGQMIDAIRSHVERVEQIGLSHLLILLALKAMDATSIQEHYRHFRGRT
jgi:hypothetical protein